MTNKQHNKTTTQPQQLHNNHHTTQQHNKPQTTTTTPTQPPQTTNHTTQPHNQPQTQKQQHTHTSSRSYDNNLVAKECSEDKSEPSLRTDVCLSVSIACEECSSCCGWWSGDGSGLVCLFVQMLIDVCLFKC